MSELITLNPTEQFLASQNSKMTLKSISDKYDKKHGNMTRDFHRMISEVSDDNLASLIYEPCSYHDENNIERQTMNLSMQTMVWFIAKFDHNLRASVVNYAFEKLEQDKALAVTEALRIAEAPKMYGKQTSVRGCIGIAFDDVKHDVSETDVWTALVYAGLAETKAKVTIKRVVPKGLEGIVGTAKYNMSVYEPQMVRSAFNKWIDDGRPSKSEYERLQEEFAQISKYYEEKLEEAKGGN